jgi:hypothetical protein
METDDLRMHRQKGLFGRGLNPAFTRESDFQSSGAGLVPAPSPKGELYWLCKELALLLRPRPSRKSPHQHDSQQIVMSAAQSDDQPDAT